MKYLLTRVSLLLLALAIQACINEERPSNDNSRPASQNQNSASVADVQPINKNENNLKSDNANSGGIGEKPRIYMVGQSLSNENFKQSVNSSSEPALVFFTAQWCQPCGRLVPIIEAVAQRHSDKIIVFSIDVDENSQTAQTYNIKGIPTMILFKGGKEIDRVVGATSEENLSRMIDRAR